MATRTPTFAQDGENTVIVTWTGLTNATSDVGAAIGFHDYADRTVQVKGTFGTGGNLRVQGSNDGGTTYAVLTDPQGNDLNIGAAKVEQVMEMTELIRPSITAGDGTTSLTCILTMRRQRSGKEI